VNINSDDVPARHRQINQIEDCVFLIDITSNRISKHLFVLSHNRGKILYIPAVFVYIPCTQICEYSLRRNRLQAMAQALMFLGTGSDVGKSVAATAFCRILARRGVRVAPFKAQNMSNNSSVAVEGGEIGRAQVVQAEAAGLAPSVHMNPVLLKPSSETGSQIILQGHVFDMMDAVSYHSFKPQLKQAIRESFHHLAEQFDVIVMEGAGSCLEMNLKDNDIVNFPLACEVGARCILVADIDRGGVFAQIIGSHMLMTDKERQITAGYLINKFRGDASLFDAGRSYIEEATGKPVFGLIPAFTNITIDAEDSVAIQDDRRSPIPPRATTVNIAVVRLPGISNFTDFEILDRETDVVLNFLVRPEQLTSSYNIVILPGTKNVMNDARWLSETGWVGALAHFVEEGKRCYGICGGFQLLGKTIADPHGVESSEPAAQGLDILPVTTVLDNEKVVRKAKGTTRVGGHAVDGYEIHMGRSTALDDDTLPFVIIEEAETGTTRTDGLVTRNGRIAGTYLHGLFDEPSFRNAILNAVRREKGLDEKHSAKSRRDRFAEYDKLADHFERYCDIDGIIGRK